MKNENCELTLSFNVAFTAVKEARKRFCREWSRCREAFCAVSIAWSVLIVLFIRVYPLSRLATRLLMFSLVFLSSRTEDSTLVTLIANLSLILSVITWFFRSSSTSNDIRVSWLFSLFTDSFSCLNSESNFFSKASCELCIFTQTPSTVATWWVKIFY